MNINAKKGMMNFASSILYKIITITLGLVIPKLFITSYGSEINGLQSSVNQIFTYIALIEGGIGAATLQSLFAPVAKNDNRKVNEYLSATSQYYNKIGIIYFVLLLVIGLFYSLVVKVENFPWYFVVAYVLLSGALSGINFFYLAKLKLLISAKGDEYIVTSLTMCTFIGTSILKIILIQCGVNILILQAGTLAINMIITLVYYIIAKKKYPWLSFKEKPDKSCVEQKNSVLVHRISSLIFQNIDVVLLTFICGLKIVSIYTIYKMVVSTVTSIVASMGESVNFILGQSFNTESDENKKSYCKMIDTFNVYYSAISFGLFSVMCILIIPFMKIYTKGMDQSYIYGVLPFLYIAIELLTVGREAMMRTIEVAGHFKKTQWRAVAESVINLSVSVVAMFVCKKYFGDIGGLYGALIGTIAAMLYRTIDINIYANRKILNRSYFKTFWIMIVNAVVLIICMLFIKPLIGEISSYTDFFIQALWLSPLVLIICLVLQSVMNVKEFKSAYDLVIKRLVRKG